MAIANHIHFSFGKDFHMKVNEKKANDAWPLGKLNPVSVGIKVIISDSKNGLGL